MTREEAWKFLVESGITTDEAIDVVTCINGYNMKAMQDILYAKTGYRDFDQIMKEEK